MVCILKRPASVGSVLLITVFCQACGSEPSLVESGTIALHFLQKPVGEETYELTASPSGGLQLTAQLLYNDRRTTVSLDATLDMESNYRPTRFVIKGKSYRWSSVDSFVEVNGRRAQVRDRGEEYEELVPEQFFTIDGYSPLSVQGMLIRYWTDNGKPNAIPTLPGGQEDGVVEVEYVGRDQVVVGDRTVDLDRFTVNNVIWGRESVWLNERGEFAAATTMTGGLPLQAIRKEYASALSDFVRIDVAVRVKDLRRLSRSVTPLQKDDFAIVGATLVDGTGRSPVPNSVVVVRNGRIEAAGSRADVPVPPGVPVVDGSGKMLLSGLWDMHAHVTQIEWAPAYLAAGITTARHCGGALELSTAMRDDIAEDRSFGPRLLLAGFVDGPGQESLGVVTAANEAEARAVVAQFKEAGIDQVKVYGNVKADVLRALSEEAHRVGMTVTGHVPTGLSALDAVQAGLDQINHLGGVVQAMQENSDRAIQVFKERRTVIDPTLAWSELTGHPTDIAAVALEPGMAKAPYQLASLINTAGVAPSERSNFNARQAEQLKVVAQLHRAGIPIVAGTDKGLPGHSLYRELELYVRAGLTPLEAIQSATIVPARAMGLDGDVGTIEAGKRADLILVEGNPLQDIRDIRRVSHVIAAGRVYETAPLWRSVGFRP